MNGDLSFFSDELLEDFFRLKGMNTQKSKASSSPSGKKRELPSEFKLSEDKVKKLKSLEKDIYKELLQTKLTMADLKESCSKLIQTKYLRKDEILQKIAEALCNSEDFYFYYSSFDEEARKYFRELAYTKVFTTNEVLLRLTGKYPVSRFGYGYILSELPLSFILCYESFDFISLPPAIKKCLQIYFEKELPSKKEISQADFEKEDNFFSDHEGLEFFINLPQILQVLTDSGFFDREAGAAILKGTLAKVSKVAALSNFSKKESFEPREVKINKNEYVKCSIDPKNIEKIKNARASLALTFLSLTVQELCATKAGKEEFLTLCSQEEKLLKKLVEVFFNSRETVVDRKYFFSEVAFRFDYFVESAKYRSEAFSKIFTLIKENPPKTPLDFYDYIDGLEDKGLPPLFRLSFEAEASYSFPYENKYNSRDLCSNYRFYVATDSIYKGILQNAGLTNLFLMLASLGLFELSWKLIRKEPEKPSDLADWANTINHYKYGQIQTIRITPLGMYVFGITDKLEVEGIKHFAPPRLDENSLIIHIDEGDKSMQIFLEPFCIPLSRTLFKADEAKLKKHCSTRESVKTVFNTLNARTEGKMPAIWENLRKSILESFVTLSPETDWLIFSLEKQPADIIRHIEKLSREGLCCKMEGKRIALKSKDFQLFKKRLEASGFKFN